MRISTFLGASMLTTLCGSATADHFTFTWEWVTYDAATGQVTNPSPTHIQPGEGVEFRGSFSFSPEVGTVRKFPPWGSGVVSGFAKVFADFNASANHGGVFDPQVVRNPALGSLPIVGPDGVGEIQVGQFALPGLPLPVTSSTVEDAIIVRWMPTDYSNRIVDFELVKSPATQFAAALYINIGTLGDPLYATINMDNQNFHGGSIQIPIVPSPSAITVFAAVGILAGRRRRIPLTREPQS